MECGQIRNWSRFYNCEQRGYRILKERVLLLDGKAKEFNQFVGMDFHDPDLDFLKLAGSMGVPATRTKKPKKLEDHIKTALQSKKTVPLSRPPFKPNHCKASLDILNQPKGIAREVEENIQRPQLA